MNTTLKNKVVLVTGGGQGLGAAISRKLASAEAIVVPVDIHPENVTRIVNEIIASGGRARGYVMNVADEKNVQDVIQAVLKDQGRLDSVINNAGVDYTKPVEELSLEEWDRVIQVNLRGPFLVSKTAFPHLKRSDCGHIVNIVSTASKRAWANASAYHASKWGLLGLSHALHVEARANNIKVTAVVAGGMQTPFILERFPDVDPGVLQDPDNVADAVRYVLTQPKESVIPELMVIPMRETSWP